MRAAFPHQFSQRQIQGMFRIRSIESMVAITAADDQIRCLQLGQFILDGAQREKAEPRQFPGIEFGPGLGKKQAQHLGPHNRKHSMEQTLFDALRIASNALSSQVHRPNGSGSGLARTLLWASVRQLIRMLKAFEPTDQLGHSVSKLVA